MNAFYEHHQDSIRFGYRCFDRILLNGLIQPFQQPERVVLLKGMSSEKHFSPPEWPEYFFDIQPPAPVATFVLQRLDRFVPVRSGPRGRGATGLGCSLVPVVSCSLRDGAIRFSETHKLTGLQSCQP